MYLLPTEDYLDIGKLSQIFKHTTNSYKYLFFISILSLLKKSHFENMSFSFNQIEEEMLDIARYPIQVFRLSFGATDKVKSKLEGESCSLLEYVPYRLITPFLESPLKGISDSSKNKKVESLSKEKGYNAIYQIEDKTIRISSSWFEYFKKHFSIIEGWSLWHWSCFLQKKNPNVMGIQQKLIQANKRESMERQTKYWKEILKEKRIACVFSNKVILEEKMSIDHFLPWSFLGHNQLWNLIPINRSLNSSKSDKIPDLNRYLEPFVSLQKEGMNITKRKMKKKEWLKYMEDFAVGLRINLEEFDNLDENTLYRKYKETVRPLETIASNMGFATKWFC